jgi:serine/threonine protein phosphatase PrpC
MLIDKASSTVIVSVMDGHGGPMCAHTMSQWIPRVLIPRLTWLKTHDKMQPKYVAKALTSSFLEADARWIDTLSMLGETNEASDSRAVELLAHMGTCALTAVVAQDFCAVASAGDSRALLIQVDEETKVVDSCWLHNVHVPANADEYDQIVALTRQSDKLPCHPSLSEIA